jgi:hypothetical protein
VSAAELLLALVLLGLLYRLLSPLRARLESFLLDRLAPGRRRERVIDVKSKKKE